MAALCLNIDVTTVRLAHELPGSLLGSLLETTTTATEQTERTEG